MRKFIWTVAVLAFLTASAANAGSTEETVGVGAGGVIGAVAGGPVGFIVGAAIGAKLGDSARQKNEHIDELENNVVELQSDVRTVSAALNDAEQQMHPELLTLLQAGIEMDLLFRTDESALTDTTSARLGVLAQRIAALPDVRIRLDGFADERGDADYNYALSEKRVDFVRQTLLDAGVAAHRIDSVAHGEVVSDDGTVDTLALERRVSVRLFIDDAPSAVAQHR